HRRGARGAHIPQSAGGSDGRRFGEDDPDRAGHCGHEQDGGEHMRSVTRARGMALITSLLLLVVVTILAVSMFRSFTVEGKIAGNVREKQRALLAAESAEQYGEWWLRQGSNSAVGSVICNTVLDANNGDGQICSNTLPSQFTNGIAGIGTGTWPGAYTEYTPPGM